MPSGQSSSASGMMIRRIVRIPLHAGFVCPLCGTGPVRIALPGARA